MDELFKRMIKYNGSLGALFLAHVILAITIVWAITPLIKH